eukprot:CAMPEP_0181353042 /NCGR_PEP_ID=MMETSP1106-20121128/2627_1 /TAXON_ID=81844 /ORGANISM="Mantoniella antarctica, Strain SL-175" /LENGTH=529 /DNA_ID=CAMNT_0023465633 /DNA_START=139 /DNA_END=1724 /DNA_ORIENTATION=+
MASKVNLSRHWEHISSDTYDIPHPALASGHVAEGVAKERDQWRDTDTSKARRNYARNFMQGKGVAFLGMGLGTTEVTSLRSITPLAIKKEHDRARAHTPSKIIPGLRKDVRGDPMAARPITNSALEFRERRRKDDYGLGHAGELRRKAHDTVEKSYPIYGRVHGEYVDRYVGTKTPEWPERTKAIPRPTTTGVPSFPTGGTHPEVGGVAGCPGAIRFLRSIHSSTPGTSGGGTGGGGHRPPTTGGGEEATWDVHTRGPPLPPRRDVRTPQRLMTGHSYTAKRAEADAAVENLLSAVKGKRPPPLSPGSRAVAPWNREDGAAVAATQKHQQQLQQPRHGDDGYSYSLGGLPPAWGKMSGPPASSGGVANLHKSKAAYAGPPIGTPAEQSAMNYHMNQQRLRAVEAGPAVETGDGGSGVQGSAGVSEGRRGTGSRLLTGMPSHAAAPPSRGGVRTGRSGAGGSHVSSRGRTATGNGVVVGIDLNDDTTEALLDELGRRGLMPGRPDTASMEAALRSLATSWDAEAAGGRVS